VSAILVQILLTPQGLGEGRDGTYQSTKQRTNNTKQYLERVDFLLKRPSPYNGCGILIERISLPEMCLGC